MSKILVTILLILGALYGTVKVAQSLTNSAPHGVDRDARVKKMGNTKRIPKDQNGWTFAMELKDGVISKDDIKRNFAYTAYLVSYEVTIINEHKEIECQAKVPMWFTIKTYSDGEPKDVALIKATKDYVKKVNEPYKLLINSKEPDIIDILSRMCEREVDKFNPDLEAVFAVILSHRPTKPYTFDHVK